ncbi:MAG: hypothetical protein WC175_02160 [Candidatus Dojkabacteria bacterium]
MATDFETRTDNSAIDNTAVSRRMNKEGGIRRRILGLPPAYTAVADYQRRIYDKTILADFPIINFTPGILKYKSEIAVHMNALRNIVASDLLPIETDGRRTYFKYAYPEYARYLNILATNVFNRMMNTGAKAAYLTIQDMLELNSNDPIFSNDSEYIQEYANFSIDENDALQKLRELNTSLNNEETDPGGGSSYGAGGNNNNIESNLNQDTVKKLMGITSPSTENPQVIQSENPQVIQSPNIRTYGLSFFSDAGTVANDSIDNSYTESELERNSKATSDEMREIRFSMSNSNIFGKVTDIMSRIPDILNRGVGTFTTPGAISAIMRGAKMTFPKVFEDSNFSRSYSISFRFVSPYGDKYSIFQYVYLPMLSLLCMILPRQIGTSSYIAPFLVKVDFPGNFAVDMGVITRMSIEKAADSNSWSIDGLPLQMNVTIDIMDLYPVMMMARSGKFINQSVSMGVYLNNLAGLSLDVENPIGRFFESRYDRFMSRVNYLADTPERTIDNVKDRFWHSLNQTFRM